MLGSLVTWFKALSIAGKTGVVAATTIVGGTGVAAVSPEPPAQTQTLQTVQCSPMTTQVTETKAVDFSHSEVEDPKLEKGKSEVRTAGASGENKFAYTVTEYSPANCQPNTKTLDKEEVITKPIAQVTAIGTYVAPPPPPPAPPKPQSNCAPGYSPCVPNVSYDLDCPDIGFSVTVTGSDPHGFDRDGDGHGCESY